LSNGVIDFKVKRRITQSMLKSCKSAPPSSVQMIMRFATQHIIFYFATYNIHSRELVGFERQAKIYRPTEKRGFSRWTVTPIWFYSQSRYLGTCAKLMLASTFRDKLRRILGCGSFAPLSVLNQCKKIWFYVLSVSLSLQKHDLLKTKQSLCIRGGQIIWKDFPSRPDLLQSLKGKRQNVGRNVFWFFFQKPVLGKEVFCRLTLFFFSDEQVNEAFFLFQHK